MSFKILEFGSNGRYNEIDAEELERSNLLVVLQKVVGDTVLSFFGRFRHFCLSLKKPEPQLVVLKEGEAAHDTWKGYPPLNYMVVHPDGDVQVGFMGDSFLVTADE